MTPKDLLTAAWRRLPPGLRAAVPVWLKARLRPQRPPPARPAPRRGQGDTYASGAYWAARSELLYYQYFRYIVRCIGHDARSMADVGSGNCPYLEWFDWIPDRVSCDIRSPYRSATVRGVQGNILALDFPERFDLVSCLQVLEHVDEPAPFARRLLGMGRLVLVSVPHRWPRGATRSHVNDPVDLRRVERWFCRRANYHLLVREPFVGAKGERLFVLFDADDPARRFGGAVRAHRRPLSSLPPPG
jgi:hypothetical protein